MGYESKVYVCNRGKSFNKLPYNQCILALDLSKMGYDNGWIKLFNKELEGDFYGIDFSDVVKEDCYGDYLTYAPLTKVKEWAENEIKKGNDYRRIYTLYNVLNSFDEKMWDELIVVHYGY